MPRSAAPDSPAQRPRTPSRLRVAAVIVVAAVMGLGSWAYADHTGFTDVPSGAFFHDAVGFAVDNELTTGYAGTNQFRPELNITRGEVVTFLHRYHQNLAPASETWAASTVLVPTGAPAPNNFTAVLGKNIGGAGATRVGTGTYRVAFARDITPCLYQATAQGTAARMTTVNAGPSASTVDVRVRNQNGALVDGVIHVTVTCPAG